jgi:transcription elongation factor GreA
MTKELKEYLTAEKKVELEKELENLKSVKRKEIADAIEWAKSLGDLSENAEYSQARDDQARNESRISEIENILQNAIITNGPNTNSGISVGSTVIVKKSDGEVNTFTIVGSEEVDIEEGKVSNESPLGSALLGKDAGDKVTFMAPKGEMTYTIQKVD